MLKYLCKLAGVEPGPETPEGVYARVVDGRTLYVNTTGEEKKVPITGTKQAIMTDRVYWRTVILGAQEAELVQ